VNEEFQELSDLWTRSAWHRRIHTGMTWLGIPIWQLPEDMIMMAELIQTVKPDVIVETGTAHGGTAVFYASMLELLGKGKVISVDIYIQNRQAIQEHPMGKRITLIQTDSLKAVDDVASLIAPDDVVLVALDSDHSCKHVLGELEAYSKFVGPGSYIVAFDGVMRILADLPSGSSSWVTDSPATAIEQFLASHQEFESDPHYNRLGITYCPNGFLRRI
jgi:cephalosporin hydroxylase